MIFTSIDFLIFFTVVFGVYWYLPLKYQNIFLLLVSYFFYGCWSWVFLSLILVCTVVDFFCGLGIYNSKDADRKRFYLICSLGTNLGILGVFKYFDFFYIEFFDLLAQLNLAPHVASLQILLPLGISFYTLQTLSYTIDIYRGKMEPTRNFMDFALYVVFFPKLIAGPIERAIHFLPQIQQKRRFDVDRVVAGFRLTLWGFFMKLVVADSIGKIVDRIYFNPSSFSGITLLVSTYLFAFQVFADFAGYTNIARGVARIFGFELCINFNQPYIARSPIEFWKRWHISLSKWFRDYCYFPLARRYKGIGGFLHKYKAHFYAMLLLGLWHGGNWTFVIFGIYWGLLIISYLKISDWVDAKSITLQKQPLLNWFFFSKSPLCGALKIILMFNFVCLGWIFFRARTLADAGVVIRNIFLDFSPTSISVFMSFGLKNILVCIGAILFMEILHFFQRRTDMNAFIGKCPFFLRWGSYYLIIFLIFLFGRFGDNEFIYFQF